MKAFTPNIILLLALLVLPATGMAAPKALPEAPVYKFAPVPEGQGLSHDFTVKNLGDTPLKIVAVVPP